MEVSRRQKMLFRKGALAGSGGTDEDDQRQVGKCELFFHRELTSREPENSHLRGRTEHRVSVADR